MSELYRQLCDKVDAFFARVSQRHPEHMSCDRGCYDCCDVRLTITGVEAAAVLAAWLALPQERRDEVRATWRPGASACAALDRQGRCAVYDGRPLVCRSHGVPVRMTDRAAHPADGAAGGDEPGPHGHDGHDDASASASSLRRRSLPVVDVCFRNFTERGPEAADPDCVLDQTTLSAMLLLVDQQDAEACDRQAGLRFELADLLTEDE